MTETIYTVKLLKIEILSANTLTYYFEKPAITWAEGTNIHLAFEDHASFESKYYVRHFSIMNTPDKNYIAFTTRLSNSPFKSRLKTLKIGETMLLFKPTRRMPLRYENRPVMLISMGVGLSAMLPKMAAFIKEPIGIKSLESIQISKDILFSKMIHEYGINHQTLTNRDSFYSELSRSYQKDAIYYIVGSDDFVSRVGKTLLNLNHDKNNINLDMKPDKKARLLDLLS